AAAEVRADEETAEIVALRDVDDRGCTRQPEEAGAALFLVEAVLLAAGDVRVDVERPVVADAMIQVDAAVQALIALQAHDCATLPRVADARVERRPAESARHGDVVLDERLRVDELLDRIVHLARPLTGQHHAARLRARQYRARVDRECRWGGREIGWRVVDAPLLLAVVDRAGAEVLRAVRIEHAEARAGLIQQERKVAGDAAVALDVVEADLR